MKKFSLTLSALAVVLLSAACTSTPTASLLDRAREDYRAVSNSPMAATYAPLETQQAGDALALANGAAQRYESQAQIDQLAYVAQQKIALTREVINRRSAEAEIARAGQQRDQLLLEQRSTEADQSKLKAQMARNDATDAQRSTEAAQAATADARRSTLAAQSEAARAKQGTQAANTDAANAQRMAQEAQERSTRLEAQLSALAAKKTAHGMVITLSDVLFGTDLSRLSAQGMRSVQKLATLLQDNPQRTVLVEGFTDSTGSEAHNLGLSERRADTVRDALLSMGVAQSRVATHGYGEALPVAANDTAANRQLNRRVEIVLSDDMGAITPR